MQPNWQFWLNFAVQLAIALSTLGAVLVALFGRWLQEKFAPPLLSLSISNERGVKAYPSYLRRNDGTSLETTSRWYHVRLQNGRRWSPARETAIYMVDIATPDASGNFVSQSHGTIPLKVRNEGILLSGRTIGPSIEYDLCSVTKSPNKEIPNILEVHLAVTPTPLLNIVRSTQPIRLILTLRAHGTEVDSESLQVEISWNGTWSDDEAEMARHLVVRPVSPARMTTSP